MPNICILGDSIAWGAWDPGYGGWAERFKDTLDKKQVENNFSHWCPVYNLSISGAKVSDTLLRANLELSTRLSKAGRENCITILALGVNDSVLNIDEPHQNVTTEDFSLNYKNLIKIASATSSNVFSLGLLPVDEDRVQSLHWGGFHIGYSNSRVDEFDKIIRECSQQNGIEYINLKDTWKFEYYRGYLLDGVHPNSKGHEWIFKKVLDALSPYIP
jgi:lysophospholipase L1-like esterase